MNMKKMKYALGLVIAVAFSSTAFGQALTNDAENDTIALGSTAQYHVDLYFNDVAPNVLYNNSGVVWSVSGDAAFAMTDFTIDGTNALTTGTDGAYNQQDIYLNAKALSTSLVLNAQEMSRPLVGTGCLAANTTTRNIIIVTMPTATFGSDSGGCALPANLNIPVNFTGYGKYDVAFSIQAYDLSGIAQGAAVPLSSLQQYNSRVTDAAKLRYITLATGTFVAVPAAGGYYDISMTNLQDRISQKTMSYAFGTTEVANANPASGDVYRFYVYPQPVTQPVQHLQNNY
jgi:hypothetical protein